MKVEKPTKEFNPKYVRRTNWYPLWEAAKNAKDGEWIPVLCENSDEKRKIQIAATSHRNIRFHTASDIDNRLKLYIKVCRDPKCLYKHSAGRNQ